MFKSNLSRRECSKQLEFKINQVNMSKLNFDGTINKTTKKGGIGVITRNS